MSINRYLRAYNSQKANAAQRGIEFKLTFKEWCDFWGDDVDRRGNGPNDLQMHRFADTGAYEIGNIRKGTPKQNMVTAGLMRRTRATELAAKIHQSELDKLMHEESGDSEQLDEDDQEYAKLGFHSTNDLRAMFTQDK